MNNATNITKTEPLIDLINSVLKQHKAEDIALLDLRSLCDFTDYMIVCTANSSIHGHTLVDYVVQALKKNKTPPIGVEGKTEREWILIDLGDIIVHIMLESVRAFYDLESLWRKTDHDQAT